jgi:hypothetical protein
MRTRASIATDQLLVCYLLISDVGADHLLVPPDGRDEVRTRPEFVTRKIPQLAFQFFAIQIELFPFRYPITSATEYFGGIDISISTWSGIRYPSGTCTLMSRGSGDYDPVTLRSP